MDAHLLTIAEAAEYLNVPFTWLRDKVSAREVPHTRLGRHVRFTPEHLDQIIRDGEQRSQGARVDSSGLSPLARKRPLRSAAAN
jgi:excisionase family DNA binding protein